MNQEDFKNGITPSPEFIAGQDTGEFIQILPDTFFAKGAKNEKGFNQAYALTNNRNEYLFIDVVELATKKEVEEMVNSNAKIRAILITSQNALNDAYADLQTISEDAGGADIYIHPGICPQEDIGIKKITGRNAHLSDFGLEVYDLSVNNNGKVLIYSTKNGGMLFTGDSVKGTDYGNEWSTFEREKPAKKEDEFALSKNWSSLNKDFAYLLPRIGKPAIEVDDPTRVEILDKISRGVS